MIDLLQEIGFVVYPVSNVSQARSFYADTLGLKETANWQDQWVEYDIGPSTFAITSAQPGTQPGVGGALAAWEVKDFDAVAEFLRLRQVSWSTPPFETPVCRGGIIKDPDGNQIMIHQRKPVGPQV